MWTVADNFCKGVSLNDVQIAQSLIELSLGQEGRLWAL